VLASHLVYTNLVLCQPKRAILCVLFLFQHNINMSFKGLNTTQHNLTFIAAYLCFKLFLIRSRFWAIILFFECWFNLLFCNCLFLRGLTLVQSVEILRCRLLFDVVNNLDQWFFKYSSNEYSLKKFICELLHSFPQI